MTTRAELPTEEPSRKRRGDRRRSRRSRPSAAPTFATAALLGLLLITPTKASLVFFYFMHLKDESAALKYMVAIAIAVLVIFILLTFSDYLFR